jgi:hypothetical protein
MPERKKEDEGKGKPVGRSTTVLVPLKEGMKTKRKEGERMKRWRRDGEGMDSNRNG